MDRLESLRREVIGLLSDALIPGATSLSELLGGLGDPRQTIEQVVHECCGRDFACSDRESLGPLEANFAPRIAVELTDRIAEKALATYGVSHAQ